MFIAHSFEGLKKPFSIGRFYLSHILLVLMEIFLHLASGIEYFHDYYSINRQSSIFISPFLETDRSDKIIINLTSIEYKFILKLVNIPGLSNVIFPLILISRLRNSEEP